MGCRPLTHLPVTEPLQAAVPTQDTEDWLPLRWVALQLGQGPSVLPDLGQLLWEEGRADVKNMGQCPGVQTTWTAPPVSRVPPSTVSPLHTNEFRSESEFVSPICS